MVRRELVDVTGRDAPPGAEIAVLATHDGFEIRTARWPAPGPSPRGTVVLFQGYAEFIEKYYEVVGELRARGFAVLTFDWRGQGLSSRLLTDAEKAYVRRFEDHLTDARLVIDTFVGAMPTPHFLLAHSMGGHIGLRLLEEDPQRFVRAVLCAPMTGLASPMPLWLMGLFAVFHSAIGLGRRYAWGNGPITEETFRFETNRVTSDRGRFERTAAYGRARPMLFLGGVTWRWLKEAIRSIKHGNARARVGRIACPVLIVSAGRERLVSPPSHDRLAAISNRIEVVHFPESMHEILMETDAIRARFWDAFDRFMGL